VKEPSSRSTSRRHAEHGHDGRIKDDKVYIGAWNRCAFKKPAGTGAEQVHVQDRNIPPGILASDHTSFVTKQIPVLFFFFRLHSDYHKPSDTWEKINAPSAAHLLDFIDDVAVKIDSSPERTAFVTVVEDQVRRPCHWRGRQRLRTVLRLDPGFRAEVDGVKFSDVGQDRRRRGGFKAGDILVQFGQADQEFIRFHDALRRSK